MTELIVGIYLGGALGGAALWMLGCWKAEMEVHLWHLIWATVFWPVVLFIFLRSAWEHLIGD